MCDSASKSGWRVRRWLTIALLWPLAAAAQIPVVVSVVPLQTIVERVGGEHVTVTAVVRAGQDPHTYEPTPQQVQQFTRARLYVRIGMPLETAWLPRLQALNPALVILDAGEQLPPRQPITPSTDHADHAADVHLWTSPQIVRTIAQRVRDQLTALDPAHAADYQQAQQLFDAELVQLDAAVAGKLRHLRQRTFVVYHPAWGYFAAAYGLTQLPIELDGKEPSARHLAAVITQARQLGVRVIIAPPHTNRRLTQQVARAIGAQVIVIDPLATDYRATLLRLAEVLAQADGSPPDVAR